MRRGGVGPAIEGGEELGAVGGGLLRRDGHAARGGLVVGDPACRYGFGVQPLEWGGGSAAAARGEVECGAGFGDGAGVDVEAVDDFGVVEALVEEFGDVGADLHAAVSSASW